MRLGAISEKLNVPGMPGETESNMVKRNIKLCRMTDARIHIQHVSYFKSVDYVREAQKERLPVSAEVSPHHLFLNHEIVPVMGTNSKMNPPLGTRQDQEALLNALVDNTISTIATDHAPQN